MYFRIAIIAHVEPLEDNAEWRCYEDLKLAGHAVEVLNPALYPGIINADGGVNNDMLARFMETFRPDYIATAGETPEDILFKLKESGVRGVGEPFKHFLVYGYVGKGNFGDELIFSTLRSQLAEHYPNSYVTLIGYGPAGALERHGVAAIYPAARAEANYQLNGASALLFMAGLIFDTGFIDVSSGMADIFQSQRGIAVLAALTQLAYLNDVPVVYVGIGAGPIESTEAQKHIKLASLTKPRFITRDATTSRLLLQAGVEPSLISEKADLAFLVDRPSLSRSLQERLSKHDLACGSYILVIARDCHNNSATLRGEVAAALDSVYEEYGMRAAFLDFAPEDSEIHHDIVRLMRHSETSAFLGGTEDALASLELIAAARMVLAMRLHGSILANAFGVPSVGLDYNDKIAAFYEQMDCRDYLLPLSCKASEIIRAVSSIEQDYEACAEKIERKAQDNRLLAAQAIDEMNVVIAEAKGKPEKQRLYSTTTTEETIFLMKGVQEDRDKLVSALNWAQGELRSMSESTTWKVGRAVTALPRALKDALRSLLHG